MDLLFGQYGGEFEVRDLDVSIVVKLDVASLEIAVDAAPFVHVFEGTAHGSERVLSKLVADLLASLSLPVNVVLERACFHELANDEVHASVEEGFDVLDHIFALEFLEDKELVHELPLLIFVLCVLDGLHAELMMMILFAATDVRVVVDLLRHLVVVSRVLFLDLFLQLSLEVLDVRARHNGAIRASHSIFDGLKQGVERVVSFFIIRDLLHVLQEDDRKAVKGDFAATDDPAHLFNLPIVR